MSVDMKQLLKDYAAVRRAFLENERPILPNITLQHVNISSADATKSDIVKAKAVQSSTGWHQTVSADDASKLLFAEWHDKAASSGYILRHVHDDRHVLTTVQDGNGGIEAVASEVEYHRTDTKKQKYRRYWSVSADDASVRILAYRLLEISE